MKQTEQTHVCEDCKVNEHHPDTYGVVEIFCQCHCTDDAPSAPTASERATSFALGSNDPKSITLHNELD